MPPKRKRPAEDATSATRSKQARSSNRPVTPRSPSEEASQWQRDIPQFQNLPLGWRHALSDSEEIVLAGIDAGTTKCEVSLAMDTRMIRDPTKLEIHSVMMSKNTSRQMPSVVAVRALPESAPNNSRRDRAMDGRSRDKVAGEIIFGEDVNYELDAGNIQSVDCSYHIESSEFLQSIDDCKTNVDRTRFENLKQIHNEVLKNVDEKYHTLHYRSNRCDKETHPNGMLEAVAFTDMRDVTRVFFKNMLDTFKVSVRRGTGNVLPAEIVDQLVAADPKNIYGSKFRCGFAIPELYTWQIRKLYKSLIEIGYPPRIEFL